MTKAMCDRIEEHPDYDAKIKQNPVELLLAIKHSMHETIRAEYPYVSMTDAWSSLINVRQQPEEKLMDYIKWFKQIHDVLVTRRDLATEITKAVLAAWAWSRTPRPPLSRTGGVLAARRCREGCVCHPEMPGRRR
jgi:hypothetical protein